MSKVYRGMLEDRDTGRPALSVPPKTPPLALAARIGLTNAANDPSERFDLLADENGRVTPGTGGLSVSPTWSDLPSFTVPKRLRQAYPSKNFRAARGGPDIGIWSHPAPSFLASGTASCAFAHDLSVRADKPGHAVVEPAQPMPHETYQSAVAATRPSWMIDEPTVPERTSPR